MSCISCEKCFTQKVYMENHASSVYEGNKQFSCEVCEKRYKSSETVLKHKASAHEGKKPLRCDNLEIVYQIVKGLNTEEQNMEIKNKTKVNFHRNNSFKCVVCDFNFSKRSLLTRHVLTAHEKVKKFDCTICDKSFAAKKNLNSHVIFKLEGKSSLKCMVCNSNFATKS